MLVVCQRLHINVQISDHIQLSCISMLCLLPILHNTEQNLSVSRLIIIYVIFSVFAKAQVSNVDLSDERDERWGVLFAVLLTEGKEYFLEKHWPPERQAQQYT